MKNLFFSYKIWLHPHAQVSRNISHHKYLVQEIGNFAILFEYFLNTF